jgi:uncharacterized membrane protein SirB2
MYLEIKLFHIICVISTLTFFLVRVFWKFFFPHLLQQRWVKIVPHTIDTLLFVSGITLVVLLQQYPFVHDWITIKFFMVLTYIVCGALVLKYAKTVIGRLMALFISILSAIYIILLAFYHQPNPFS